LSQIERAILCTVLYADVFDFAMTPREIHHFLICETPVALADIEDALHTSTWLRQHIDQRNGLVFRAGREELVEIRAERERIAAELMPAARMYGSWLSRLPFVRMVALTGALAMRNPDSRHDDFDYLLVTAPGRVWLARAFSILLVRLGKLRGVTICPNYVLSESALVQDNQNLFIAHELAQMLPLFGHDLYRAMRAANGWSNAFLPNAKDAFYTLETQSPAAPWRLFKQALEVLLGGRLGNRLEAWERRRKLRRFAADLQTPEHAARLDDEHVKGHFQDHGQRVLREYRARLEAHGLLEASPKPNHVSV